MKLLFTFLLCLAGITVSYSQKYVFYLHGMVAEGNCEHPSSNIYGEFKYREIIAAFRDEKFTVLTECRPANTDVKQYAHKVAAQVDSLIKAGVKPASITVIGASKGSMIAMYVSTFLKNARLNFVFMSCCSDAVFSSHPDIAFYGNVLSIYEKSDDMAGSCLACKEKSTHAMVPHYKEIALNTGLKHGYLYRPLPEWVAPAAKWAKGSYE
jgi:hypothetical protein